MNQVTYSFIVSTLAGLSTMLGSIFVFFNFKDSSKVILRALSFAAGVMICICIIDLIPSAFSGFNTIYKAIPSIVFLLIFIIIGIITSLGIDKYLPNNDTKLYKVGIISMIAIILHNIPEGILTFMLSTHDLKLGISMALAISIHNIPEGISISIPIYYSTNNKTKAFIYTLISGLSELLGAILAYLLLSLYINDFTMSILLSIISGIMIYIPIYELLPVSLSYNKKKESIIFLVTGIIFMIISHYIIN